jgi:hypothetical protein
MNMSRDARVLAGITLITVPTIMIGGAVLLGVLTRGVAGVVPGDLQLDETQWALFRAGHAHAGVWVILSIVIQMLLDAAVLPSGVTWAARIAAPASAVAISGGFFGLAFTAAFAGLVYLGAAAMAAAVLATAVGLLRRPH